MSQLSGVGLVSLTAACGRRCGSRSTLGARRLRARHRRRQDRHHEPEHRYAQGQLRRPAAELHDQRQRPAAERAGIREPDPGLQERRRDPPVRRRARSSMAPRTPSSRPGRTGRPADHRQRAAPARRQRHRGRRRRQGPPAAAASHAAGRRRRAGAVRPDHDDPGLGLRRRVRTRLAVALVVLVIFVFLRSLPATVIPSLSVPLSLVGTLGGMYLFGFSHRQSVADVADDRHRLRGRRRHRHDREHRPLHRGGRGADAAALKGSGEIGFTIISLTVSLIAVLIPLLFMGDVVGRCSASSPSRSRSPSCSRRWCR